MKVLFIQKVKAFAGSEKHLVDLIPALTEKGFDCTLLIIIEKQHIEKLDNFFQVLTEKKIQWNKIIIEKVISLSLLNKISKHITAGGFTHVHAHLIHAELWSSLLKLFFRKNFVLLSSVHSFDEKYQSEFGYNPSKIKRTKYFWICKFNSYFVNEYVFVSNALKKLYKESGLLPHENATVIHHGIRPLHNSETHILDTKTRNPISILVPGRIVPYKGQELVIEALYLLIKKHGKQDIKITFIGDLQGDYYIKLKKLIDLYKIDGYFSFLGHVKNPDHYFKAADMVIIPSKVEGFGLVVLEAYKYGKPVIAFDVKAINELIKDKRTGLLIPPYHIQDFSECIYSLIIDSDLRIKLGKNGIAELENNFNFDHMVNKYFLLYNNSIKKKE